MLLRKLPIAFLILLFPFFVFSQNTTIKGVVKGNENNKPIEFTTVVLFQSATKIVIRQEISSKNGSFQFANLPVGSYVVKANFVGYKTYQSSLLQTEVGKSIQLNINLNLEENNLNEVVVSGNKQLYNNSIDRKIYNVGQDIMAKSGSASEVLQNVPLVQVDIDGNVTLRNAATTILINGKISPIMGKNAAAALQQLPANSIERIEVITNPSAKYKPDGTGGIINIVMKKNTKNGLNGGVTANVGNQDRYNANVTLNYKPGKLNLFGGYSIKKDYRLRLTSNARIQKDASGTESYYNDEITASARPFSNTANLGAEYAFDDKNSFGISGNYYFRSIHKNDFTLKNVSDASGLISDYTRTRTNYESEKEADATVFFEHDFAKEDHKIRLEYIISHSPEVEDNHYKNIYKFPATANQLDNTLIKQTSDNKQLTVAYENQITKKTKLELGYDGQFNQQDLDFYGEAYN